MNIAMRKLAMLEKEFTAREEEARISGYDTCPIDKGLQRRITELMDKVRVV